MLIFFLKQRICDINEYNWRDSLNSTRFDTYRQFNQLTQKNIYMFTSLPLCFRIRFATLRCSGLKFEIASGRNKGIINEQCDSFAQNNCKLNDKVETELVCVFVCVRLIQKNMNLIFT